MICEGGPLNGEYRDTPGARLLVPTANGRKLVGWDDGFVWAYPEHIYTRRNGRWEYDGLRLPREDTLA